MTGSSPGASELPGGSGLSWSWDLDLDALLAVVSDLTSASPMSPAVGIEPELTSAGPGLTCDDQVEAEFAEYLEAVDAGRSVIVPLSAVAGSVAESLPASPDLAGWLASIPAVSASDYALTGLASSYRRLASWAQGGELAAVAQLASRSAAADDRIGVDETGRPASLPQDACGQVSLALTMSPGSASWWTDLAVTLEWRLPATGIALRAGLIDLSRARAIAEATAVLDDDTARSVESRVLARAGDQTLGQLRAALRRAVIAADPHGADRRREEAERRAKVTLYPDAEGTAGLAGYNLPGIQATAAMARITALARAMKAAGAGGGIDLLRSQVFLGLLLDTLPHIPPGPDSPPDENCPPDGGCPPRDGGCPPRDGGCPPDGGLGDDGCFLGDGRPADHGWARDDSSSPSDGDSRDDGASFDGGLGDDVIDHLSPWPDVTAFLRAGPAAMGHLLPAGGGFLDLRVPWVTLTGDGTEPAHLSRLGAITMTQASHLAQLAARDPAVDWRVIVTGPDGQALAIDRVRRRSARAGPAPPPQTQPAGDRHADHYGLVKRVTVTITQDELAMPPETRGHAAHSSLPAKLAQVLDAATRANDRAAELAAADAAADGCAHTQATDAYKPPASLKEYVTARDITCRFPTCRQPVTRCDLDHTKPYDQGGKTCPCNLGGLCRHHHQLKQHRRWKLTQPKPGIFTWTTPTGRTCTTGPDSHAA